MRLEYILELMDNLNEGIQMILIGIVGLVSTYGMIRLLWYLENKESNDD